MVKNKMMIRFIAVFIIITSFSACGSTGNGPQKPLQIGKLSYPLTITDSYHRKITILREPKKIISVAPNITEIVFALGQGRRLVGRSDFCDYPEKAKKIVSIGSLETPNIEKMVNLHPDLIIASTHFQKDVLNKLENLGLKVVVLYGTESFDGVYDVIRKVAQALNVKSEADKIIVQMKNEVANVRDKVNGASRPSVYYILGFGEYGDFTAGKDTFISQMIKIAGGKNAADDVEGWKYSLEKLVEKDPDILICSLSGQWKKQIMAANGYKDLTAVKKGNLFEIDKNLLERPGPRLADGVQALAKIIHPDLFQ